MNRAVFFQKVTFFLGSFLTIPAFSKNKKYIDTSPVDITAEKAPLRKKGSNDFNAKTQNTPWGQEVFYDQYTYMDFQKSQWRSEGKSEDEIESLTSLLQKKIDGGEIDLRNGPAKLASGLT